MRLAEEETARLEAALPGLVAPAEARLDAVDVPRIEAANLLDAVRAEGWLHADARFLQMDLTRREASARLSEIVPQAVALDRRSALLGLSEIAERALAALPALVVRQPLVGAQFVLILGGFRNQQGAAGDDGVAG